ncbi:MAG: SUMF1/EgtB/PvdO family nonheme iron enzyme [Bacteroidales bacterium]|nr:SUMF1/EgtB/PvdO family nonheme iron enzyme [Bacteroidales bacterium]
MSDADPLEPYVREWHAARARGKDPAAEELCWDRTDLIPALTRRLDELRTGRIPSLTPEDANAESLIQQDENQFSVSFQSRVTPVSQSPPSDFTRTFAAPDGKNLPPSPKPSDKPDGITTPEQLIQLGDYRILYTIGEGGMGVVYCAEDTRLGRQVALKVIRHDFADRPKFRNRFLNEARSQARIEHENITPIYQAGEDSGRLFIAMPILRGESLRKRLDQEKRPPIPFTIQVGIGIAEGLAAAHALHVIHRDVKPANVWIEAQANTSAKGGFTPARCKLLDFGLARAIASEEQIALTGAGDIMGTPAYMSPAQATGTRDDPRVDLYSLGVLLYEMTTGRLPFTGDTPVSVIMKAASETATPVIQLNPDVPAELSGLIERLMSRDPVHQKMTAAEVAEELGWILEQVRESEYIHLRATRPVWQRAIVPALISLGVLIGGLILWDISFDSDSPVPPFPATELAQGHSTQTPSTTTSIPVIPVSPPTPPSPPATTSTQSTPIPPVPATKPVPIPSTVTVRVMPVDSTIAFHPQGETGGTIQPGTLPGSYLIEHPVSVFQLRLEKKGFLPQELTVDRGRTREYTVALVPAPPPPTVIAHILQLPRNATVTFPDDPTAQKQPTEPGRFIVARRKQSVRVAVPGYKTVTLELKPDREPVLELRLALVPEPPAPEMQNTIGLTLKLIPAGTATLGMDPPRDPLLSQKFADQRTRTVTITKPFYIGKTEVTRAQFQKFVLATGHRTTGPRWGYDKKSPQWFTIAPEFSWENPGYKQDENHPVVNVTWLEATAFCEWLSKKEGKTYRLPTEAEWEYVTRLSSPTPKLNADPQTVLQSANLADDSLLQSLSDGEKKPIALSGNDGFSFTAPVAQKAANPLGLHDLFGNVAEWCQDHYGDWAKLKETDPIQTTPHPDDFRVIRGGSFLTGSIAGTYFRSHLPADCADMQTGFRIVAEIPPLPPIPTK